MMKYQIIFQIFTLIFLLTTSRVVIRAQSANIEKLCSTPEDLVHNFFNTMSGPIGQPRDSTLFTKFYHPQSYHWYILNRPKAADTVKIQTKFTKIEKNGASQFTRWKKDGFHERAISTKVDRYENIAQVWVIAEVQPREKEPLKYRVQDSFQLWFDGSRWWIMSIAWQRETSWKKVG